MQDLFAVSLTKRKNWLLNLKQPKKRLAIPAKSPHVNRYLKTCLVKLSFTILATKKKSVAVVRANYIALVKISQRSFSLFLHRLK